MSWEGLVRGGEISSKIQAGEDKKAECTLTRASREKKGGKTQALRGEETKKGNTTKINFETLTFLKDFCPTRKFASGVLSKQLRSQRPRLRCNYRKQLRVGKVGVKLSEVHCNQKQRHKGMEVKKKDAGSSIKKSREKTKPDRPKKEKSQR